MIAATTGEPVATPARAGQVATLAGLTSLYIGFGMIMGTIQAGMPTVLRAQGLSVASAGWVYVLYMPFGLAFLWSPLVDRWRIPYLPPRTGWIIPMQLLAAAATAIIAFLDGSHMVTLFGLGIFISCAMATMDIALDGLAVDLVRPEWRSNAAAAKLAALSGGSMIGGGVFLTLFDALGWTTIFLCYAAGLLALLIPLSPLVRRETLVGSAATGEKGGKASLFRLLRDRQQRKRLILLTLACCVIFPLAALNRMMLVDLGEPLERIGWIVGTLGPIVMLITAVVSMPLMKQVGLHGALLTFAGLGLFSILGMGAGYGAQLPGLAITGTILIGAAVSGIYVAISARILGWAKGSQSATDYATFYGVGRFASTILTIAAAQFITLVNWITFYAIGACALVAITALILRPISEPDEEGNAPNAPSS